MKKVFAIILWIILGISLVVTEVLLIFHNKPLELLMVWEVFFACYVVYTSYIIKELIKWLNKNEGNKESNNEHS